MALKTIALIEDNEDVAELVRYKLRKLYNVVRAGDGLDGLEMIEREVPDLVLLDIMLPRMNGFEILERIRGNPRTAAVPVMMMSALGREDDIARSLRLGANDYMMKPFRPSDLLLRIERLLHCD